VDFQTELIAERSRAAQLELGADALRNELRAVTTSTSWRLTEPVRRLAALFPRFTHLVRRGVKVIWWTSTLTSQPISRLRAYVHRTWAAKPVATSGVFRRMSQWNKHTGASEGGATWSISELSGKADGAEAIESNPGNRKLICVTHILPWPPCADKAYVHHRILSWAAATGWDIVLLVSPVAGEELREDAIKGLTETCPNLVIISRDGNVLYRLSEGGSALAKLDGKVVAAPQLFEAEYYNDNLSNMERAFAHDGLVAVLLALTEALDPAAILVDHVFLTRALAMLPRGVRKLVRTCDVFSISENAVKLGAPDGPSITREQAGRLLARADVIIAAHADEKSILCALAPGIAVISAGMSCDIRPTILVPVRNVILLAASDIPAHVKGATDFLRFAWPIVKRSVPDAELLVTGAICGKIKSVDPNIKRVGEVHDLVGFYAQAKVVINPAIAGRDIAIETLAAFANLRPVVAWPHGTDGIDPALRPLCYIATNWYDFATKVIAVLRDVSAINRVEMELDLISQLTSSDHVYAELSTVLGRPKL